METPTEVKELLSKLRTELHYEAYLVGGAIRDNLINKQPADYDIVVCNAFADSIALCEEFAKEHNLDCSVFSKYYEQDEDLETNDPNVMAAVKLQSAKGTKIDVLCYHTANIKEIVLDFPCNASQFWLEDTTIRATIAAQLWQHAGVLQFAEDVRPEYKAKIIEKLS